jgi:acyl transferase domain-containing protein
MWASHAYSVMMDCPLAHTTGGKHIGVMVGIVNVDYFRLVLKVNESLKTSAYTAPGLALGVASGRISFTFGLTGPAASMDTACSSSLVAVHKAMNGVALGECEGALCGGVNLALTPAVTMLFNRSGMMSLDGRCKTLDSSVDGYVRAEGVMVMRIGSSAHPTNSNSVTLASSVINQDGPSSALTAPSGPSQMAAIRTGTALK